MAKALPRIQQYSTPQEPVEVEAEPLLIYPPAPAIPLAASEAQKQITAWEEEAGGRKGKERKVCLLAAAKWEGLDHIEAHKRIVPEPCTDESRKSYVTAARNVAQQIADNSEGKLIMPAWRQK